MAIPFLWILFVIASAWWPRLGLKVQPLVPRSPESSHLSYQAERLRLIMTYRQRATDCFRPSDEAAAHLLERRTLPEVVRWSDLVEAYQLSQRGYLALERLRPPIGLENAHDQLVQALYLRAGALEEGVQRGPDRISAPQIRDLGEKLMESFELYRAGMAVVDAEEKRVARLAASRTLSTGDR